MNPEVKRNLTIFLIVFLILLLIGGTTVGILAATGAFSGQDTDNGGDNSTDDTNDTDDDTDDDTNNTDVDTDDDTNNTDVDTDDINTPDVPEQTGLTDEEIEQIKEEEAEAEAEAEAAEEAEAKAVEEAAEAEEAAAETERILARDVFLPYCYSNSSTISQCLNCRKGDDEESCELSGDDNVWLDYTNDACLELGYNKDDNIDNRTDYIKAYTPTDVNLGPRVFTVSDKKYVIVVGKCDGIFNNFCGGLIQQINEDNGSTYNYETNKLDATDAPEEAIALADNIVSQLNYGGIDLCFPNTQGETNYIIPYGDDGDKYIYGIDISYTGNVKYGYNYAINPKSSKYNFIIPYQLYSGIKDTAALADTEEIQDKDGNDVAFSGTDITGNDLKITW